MRYGLLALGLAACVALSQGWFAQACERASAAALSDDARLAIEVRCQEQDSRSGRECRAMLKKLFLAGSLDPDKTLRDYCNAFKTARWGGSRPAPPDLCIERYGGWPPSS